MTDEQVDEAEACLREAQNNIEKARRLMCDVPQDDEMIKTIWANANIALSLVDDTIHHMYLLRPYPGTGGNPEAKDVGPAKAEPDDGGLEKRVKSLVSDQLCVDIQRVDCGASFIEDLGADSLDRVELLMAVEAEFGTSISEAEAERIDTVGDAIELLRQKGRSEEAK